MSINQTIGYVTPVRAFLNEGEIYMQAASGRVADALAKHYEKVYICTRVRYGSPPAPADSPLGAPNLELIAQPFWNSTAGSLPHFFGIARSYFRTCRRVDVLFVRGMCPYILALYVCAFLFRRPICHWIVGDPVSVLGSGPRRGLLFDTLGLLYALQDRMFSRLGRWLTGGAFICNGRELARVYTSPRTSATVSSTVKESEFFSRFDTCQGEPIRILFVGYIRPEKGIEYLLEAVSSLKTVTRWDLEIVGPADDFPEYRRRLDEIVAERGIHDHVRWIGYAPYGEALFDRMRAADIFVLPSLSEGTPHVLVEARANGLPCISTFVGGVPDTVTDGVDALLVPPKNPSELAQAIERIASDQKVRRALIRNGLNLARKHTLECFIETVRKELEPKLKAKRAAITKDRSRKECESSNISGFT
ncbi:MAG: glycosyltransferase family 4 protein [Candidatus Acidiferrales bacterium]|jgi:glycosyltransferase involved in cell wall biosynthesis